MAARSSFSAPQAGRQAGKANAAQRKSRRGRGMGALILAPRYNPAMTLSRRSFLWRWLASPLAAAYYAAAKALPAMKITRVETVYWKSREDAPFWPHWMWIKIDTDAGVSGIGETYPRN